MRCSEGGQWGGRQTESEAAYPLILRQADVSLALRGLLLTRGEAQAAAEMKKLEISSGSKSWSFDVQQQERGVMLNELRDSGRLGGLLQRPEVTGGGGRRGEGSEDEDCLF